MGDITKRLGLKIKELRERNNFTQLKLAELINMESSNLSKIERGIQMPKEETLEEIVKVLNIDLKELFDFEHFKSQDELLHSLINILKKSTTEELRSYYKIINSIRELKAAILPSFLFWEKYFIIF